MQELGDLPALGSSVPRLPQLECILKGGEVQNNLPVVPRDSYVFQHGIDITRRTSYRRIRRERLRRLTSFYPHFQAKLGPKGDLCGRLHGLARG
jgi:hypothetical protein